MNEQGHDLPVLKHIERLVSDEHQLHAKGTLSASDRERIQKLQIELDQCWDLLRQRRALREVGLDPNDAQVRVPEVVEKYEQ